MKDPFAVLLMLLFASPCLFIRIIADNQNIYFNVVNYGAKGDGQSDDSQAFLKAWQDVCGATCGSPTLIVPTGKTFLLQPIVFNGDYCKSERIIFQLQGNLVAPGSVNAWKWPNNDKDAWIKFSNINGLVINGGGKIDGQGASWWTPTYIDDSSRPTALHFNNCPNLQLSSLTHINSPRNHISINSCNGARISNLHIFAPDESPNTDGIDISGSSNVIIDNSIMETGDDCIAINNGSSFINISNVACGPGHGISVGSLGRNGEFDTVEEIHVHNCNFTNSQNGVRIKTWVGGTGYARKITFEDIYFIATTNPVIIDQHYNPSIIAKEAALRPSATTNKAVQVSDVTYRRLHGTSAVEDAIKFICDSSVGCSNIVVQDVNITSSVPGKTTYAICENAQVTWSDSNPNIECLYG